MSVYHRWTNWGTGQGATGPLTHRLLRVVTAHKHLHYILVVSFRFRFGLLFFTAFRMELEVRSVSYANLPSH